MTTILSVAVIIAAGVLAFLLVLFFTGRHNDSPTLSPTIAEQSPTSQPSPSSTSSQSTSTSETPSSTSETTAPFPADGTTSCMENGVPNSGTIRVDNTRSVADNTSCGFITATKMAVDDHLAQDAHATNFTISPYSDALEKNVDMQCSRANHLTTCVNPKGSAIIYIQDSVN